jgi:hypothetical protein
MPAEPCGARHVTGVEDRPHMRGTPRSARHVDTRSLFYDLGMRHAMQAAYGLEKMPSEGKVRRIAESWRPHRLLATAYLYSSLWADRAPSTPEEPG